MDITIDIILRDGVDNTFGSFDMDIGQREIPECISASSKVAYAGKAYLVG